VVTNDIDLAIFVSYVTTLRAQWPVVELVAVRNGPSAAGCRSRLELIGARERNSAP
jgi:hypothetical protein